MWCKFRLVKRQFAQFICVFKFCEWIKTFFLLLFIFIFMRWLNFAGKINKSTKEKTFFMKNFGFLFLLIFVFCFSSRMHEKINLLLRSFPIETRQNTHISEKKNKMIHPFHTTHTSLCLYNKVLFQFIFLFFFFGNVICYFRIRSNYCITIQNIILYLISCFKWLFENQNQMIHECRKCAFHLFVFGVFVNFS